MYTSTQVHKCTSIQAHRNHHLLSTYMSELMGYYLNSQNYRSWCDVSFGNRSQKWPWILKDHKHCIGHHSLMILISIQGISHCLREGAPLPQQQKWERAKRGRNVHRGGGRRWGAKLQKNNVSLTISLDLNFKQIIFFLKYFLGLELPKKRAV